MWWVCNFLLLGVHYIPLLVFFNIEFLMKINIFRGGRKAGVCGGGGGGGGGGINWSLGLGQIPGLPPPK